MRAQPGEVLHFSEDPTITRFVPRPAPAGTVPPGAYVWAVNGARCPDYWFPRDCPRVLAWPVTGATDTDRLELLGPGGGRVHLVEYAWLERMRTVRLWGYRFDGQSFTPFGEPPHARVATVPVTPLGPPEPVGDLFALHEAAGIELRVAGNLWPYWDRLVDSSLGHSGIRLRNAAPR